MHIPLPFMEWSQSAYLWGLVATHNTLVLVFRSLVAIHNCVTQEYLTLYVKSYKPTFHNSCLDPQCSSEFQAEQNSAARTLICTFHRLAPMVPRTVLNEVPSRRASTGLQWVKEPLWHAVLNPTIEVHQNAIVVQLLK